jgi:hypothetical protein
LSEPAGKKKQQSVGYFVSLNLDKCKWFNSCALLEAKNDTERANWLDVLHDNGFYLKSFSNFIYLVCLSTILSVGASIHFAIKHGQLSKAVNGKVKEIPYHPIMLFFSLGSTKLLWFE